MPTGNEEKPRCPTEPRFEGDLIGCGSTNLIWCEDEGIYDCGDCGMWFDPVCEPAEHRTFVSRGRDKDHAVPMGLVPALRQGDKDNFETIRQACKNGDLALVSSVRRRDGAHVALVCAMAMDRMNSEVRPVPLAVMIEGNPYVQFEDPTLSDSRGPEEDGDQREGS